MEEIDGRACCDERGIADGKENPSATRAALLHLAVKVAEGIRHSSLASAKTWRAMASAFAHGSAASARMNAAPNGSAIS